MGTKDILQLIIKNPFIWQRELIRLSGNGMGTVQYHLNKLLDQKLIKVKREGQKTHYYASKNYQFEKVTKNQTKRR